MIAQGRAQFLGGSKPIPVVQFQTNSGVQLQPHRLKTIVTLTTEMIDSSEAESIVRQTLAQSVGAGLDAVLFGTSGATPDQPAGLLSGITAQTPSTNTDPIGKMIDDLTTLGQAVARVASNSEIVYVAAPENAVSITNRMPKDFDYDLLASAALAKGTVLAVSTAALASAFESVPTIEASREAEIQYETTPSDIVSGSPGVVATPVGTLYQADRVGLRLIMGASWALRSPLALAWMQGATW